MEKRENNGENSSPLTSLPVARLTATDCNAAARANSQTRLRSKVFSLQKILDLNKRRATSFIPGP